MHKTCTIVIKFQSAQVNDASDEEEFRRVVIVMSELLMDCGIDKPVSMIRLQDK